MLDIAAAAELAGYQIEDRVGRGGSADVYRATRVASKQLVALKVLSPDADPRLVDREVQLLQGIEHPGVVELIDTGEVAEQRFVATRWVDGPTLAQVLLDESPLAPVRAMRIFRQIANALAAVHAADVVHGDLTPANIIVGEADVVTLVDFGIGRSGEVATITLDADMSGTPRYLAPEVIEGASPTAASDQYSSGIVLYEMLTGRWPFPGEGTVATVLHHQLMTLPTPLREVDAWLPATAEEAMDQALRKNPDERFDSVVGFADALGDTDRARASAGSVWWWVLGALVLALIAASAWVITRDADAGTGSEPAAEVEQEGAAANEIDTGTGEQEAVANATDDAATEQEAATDSAGADTSGAEADDVAAADDSAGTDASTDAATDTSAGEAAEGGGGYLSAPWPAGTAESADCNLLTVSSFESAELPEQWVQYQVDDVDIPISRILLNGGVDDTFAVEVGAPGGWGTYTEKITVTPGAWYFASAMGRHIDDVDYGALYVTWIDDNFDELGQSEDAEFDGASFTQAQLTVQAPPTATLAALTVFKNASAGTLVVDELLFAEAESECVKELAGP